MTALSKKLASTIWLVETAYIQTDQLRKIKILVKLKKRIFLLILIILPIRLHLERIKVEINNIKAVHIALCNTNSILPTNETDLK